MVSKVFSSHSFKGACRYVVNKPEAKVLQCVGVREHNYQVMADDFIAQQQLRPEKEKACFHCCLSFYPEEKVSDEQMKRIAKEYLERLKIINTQIAIIKHSDRRHLHMHIVANMVDNNGKVISDSFLGLRKENRTTINPGTQTCSCCKERLGVDKLRGFEKIRSNQIQDLRDHNASFTSMQNIERTGKQITVAGYRNTV